MPCLIVIVVFVDKLLALMVKVWKEYRNFSDCKSFQIVSTFSCILLFTFMKLLADFELYVPITITALIFSVVILNSFLSS
jgi:hypothetical protein